MFLAPKRKKAAIRAPVRKNRSLDGGFAITRRLGDPSSDHRGYEGRAALPFALQHDRDRLSAQAIPAF